jgi:hypothetical protein
MLAAALLLAEQVADLGEQLESVADATGPSRSLFSTAVP